MVEILVCLIMVQALRTLYLLQAPQSCHIHFLTLTEVVGAVLARKYI